MHSYFGLLFTVCEVKMLGNEVVEQIKANSSSNEKNAIKALKPQGWSPEADDKNPFVELDLIEEYPVAKVTARVKNIEDAEVVLLNDGVEVSRKPAEVRVCSDK